VPTLHEWLPAYRAVRICAPTASSANATFPLHIFCHGDVGGGAFFTPGYDGLQRQIASYGFVVAAFLSCWLDRECANGEADFIEALETILFVTAHPSVSPVDNSLPYSASGHSTGARAVLMLAAVRDNMHYLAKTSFAANVTADMRDALAKLKAVVADHPDPLLDPKQNPDVPGFRVTATAVFVITGSADRIEPNGSAWDDFRMLSTPDRVFVNIRGDGHTEPNGAHHEGPFIAHFSRYFALGDAEAGAAIYGVEAGSLVRSLPLALAGDANSGDGKVAFVACARDGVAVPATFASYCA
jgi:hypothetical protein